MVTVTIITNSNTNQTSNSNNSSNGITNSSSNSNVILIHVQLITCHVLYFYLLTYHSKKREAVHDLAPWLWYSFGTIAALLQEIVYIYPSIYPPILSVSRDNSDFVQSTDCQLAIDITQLMCSMHWCCIILSVAHPFFCFQQTCWSAVYLCDEIFPCVRHTLDLTID